MWKVPSCQINEVDDGRFGHALAHVVLCFLREVDGDDRVRARTRRVHVRGGESAISRTLGDARFDVGVAAHRRYLKTLDCAGAKNRRALLLKW